MSTRKAFFMIFLHMVAMSDITILQRQMDMVFCNGTVMDINLPHWTVCAELCSQMSSCKSFNFKADTRSCEINNQAPNGGSSLLINSPSDSFIDASTMAESLSGNCNTNNCYSGEICLEESSGSSCVKLLESESICKEDWVLFNGHCYFFGATAMTWADAQSLIVNCCYHVGLSDMFEIVVEIGNKIPVLQADCQISGSNLATVNNKCEQQFLVKVITDGMNRNTWIGANDLATEGQWEWVSDKSNISGVYSAWGNGEPSDRFGNENCACFFQPLEFLWNDNICSDTYAYVCELN